MLYTYWELLGGFEESGSAPRVPMKLPLLFVLQWTSLEAFLPLSIDTNEYVQN